MHKEQLFVKRIKEHEGILYKITSVYADNKYDQQDLYQEIVFNLWKAFDSFRGDSKWSTWMYRIALNTSITHKKKEKRNGFKVDLENVVLRESDEYDTTFEEQLKELYLQIKQLNALDKGLILLLLEGKKYDEIAVITGLSPSNVGTRISRIKQKLKQQVRH
ncbi:sigma-70 family RNA polymerase sigma factor [Spongiivirga sp. MCCC 1A20706]|uniref:RNA polymerase sigma factor n=1 Tax=Spongiivirga sp. MCCC 1A20706 TaxID=3160963 RepID=UPI0039779054